jgi:hypothetical protein
MHSSRFAVAALAVLALAGCGGSGGEGGAYRACERAVESQLKSPSTADFSGATGSTITSSGDTYKVSGTVDSENGFGAMVRSGFSCELREVEDNWELVNVSVA